MKQITKPLQKIRQTRMCIYNAKKQKNQPIKHTNSRVHTYEHSLKNAKIQQCKKLHYWFGNFKPQKKSNNSGKSVDNQKKCRQNDCACTIMQFASKSASISKNTLINLAKGAHQQKNAENSKNFKNKKLTKRFFKIKNSTNQIHAVLPLN